MSLRDCAKLLTLAASVCACLWFTSVQAQGVWPWSQLTASQKQILAPFQKQWDSWPVADKRAWIGLANRFPELTQSNQERANRRIREWATLSGEQRNTARSNIKLSRERQRTERAEEWNRYQQMTPEQKKVLRKSQQAGSGNRGVRSGLAPGAAQPLGLKPLKK